MKNPGHYKISSKILYVVAVLTFSAFAGVAKAGPVKSVGAMTFVDANTVVIADWRAGEIHALQLPPATSVTAKPFNLKNVSTPIAHALRSQPDKLRFEDMAFRPGMELAYITVSVDRGNDVPSPALVSVDAAGKVAVVNLPKTPYSSVEIKDRPVAGKFLWRDVPEATYTVTDMVFHEGKLYVAGLSNEKFASTLRVYGFPFKDDATATSIEMYHAVHNQFETRAPIRKMAVVTLNGEPSLVAAYTCTPLVTVPLKDLKDGAHVTGKTIAELGWGSAPVDMVTFDAGQGPMVLLINSHKSADLMTVSSIAEASAKPGLTTPIKWPNEPLLGLKSTSIPMAGIAQLGDQNKEFLCALRRNSESGDMELMSIRKGAFLRLSDFVNEYDFEDFRYGPHDGWSGVHKMLRTDEGYADLAKRAAP
ncbi:hypothetical protein [Pedosphaera parvula]|uniref:Uncharacterized protein n=1 Tax=Pedosphaera parvula (strain Ellin514) TaxID=320771 RepID=B9XAH8_PEDPL|nr:hypothetical protein [Pedosphaera parvula]EEF63013.1 hypothetical protein Cflav_PD5648 [Pedosphaera parvula Ellin514]